MNVAEAYNLWADQYDTNKNKTRDLEAQSLRRTLESIPFDSCLEIGCGTAKNTEWLLTKAKEITAVDLSNGMLEKAKAKIRSDKVIFHQADITDEWNFVKPPYDLITFSLILEHIENLEPILKKAAESIAKGGHCYIGELHPFKQYAGTKARFETQTGQQVVTCFNHHLSDFTHAAVINGFSIKAIKEYFDGRQRTGIPRILSLLLRKD